MGNDRIAEAPGRPDASFLDGRFFAYHQHDAYRWMRRHEPVFRDANGLIGVTRHADIMAVSKDPGTFCSGQGFRPDAPIMPMMISMDRPEHMVRRGLINKGFTPRRVAEMEPRVREVCGQLIDAVCERGECDFVRDVAARLPLIMIADLLGVREEDHDRLLEWSDATMSGSGNPDPQALVRAGQAFGEYREYCLDVVEERRKSGGSKDLMGLLVQADLDGERLTDDDLVFESILILNGGDETTRHVISGGMQQLIENPEQRQLLLDDPARITTAVEEMLRWVTPITNMMRTATRDTELRGTPIREGDRLLLLYPSANRDEEVFADPYRFDVRRDPNPHVAFGGYGNHFCLGNALARLELQVMFEELLRRLPDIQLANEDTLPMRESDFVVGVEHMPVRFTPVAPEQTGVRASA